MVTDKGKLAERWARKASGLRIQPTIAELPKIIGCHILSLGRIARNAPEFTQTDSTRACVAPDILGVLIAALVLTACTAGSNDTQLAAGASDDTGASPPPPQSSNQSPTISGQPTASLRSGQSYSFVPQASDPDNDPLTFTIANAPDWITFDPASGAIEGTPNDSHIGSYADIIIEVSDGTDSASLDPFDIDVLQVALGTATLSWSAPLNYEDGTAFTDLSGYNIYYGTEQGNYQYTLNIDGPSTTRYVIENLSPATYYFVLTAYNSEGLESASSNAGSKTIM